MYQLIRKDNCVLPADILKIINKYKEEIETEEKRKILNRDLITNVLIKKYTYYGEEITTIKINNDFIFGYYSNLIETTNELEEQEESEVLSHFKITVENYNKRTVLFEIEYRKCATCELYPYKPEEQFDGYKRIFLSQCKDCKNLFCQYCYFKRFNTCLECSSIYGDILTSIDYKNLH